MDCCGAPCPALLRDDMFVSSGEIIRVPTYHHHSGADCAGPCPCPRSAGEEEIVVTAALTPLKEAEAPASVTLLNGEEIEALGLPEVVDLLRLSPGVAVAQSGGSGSQAQVRIRGAEANHSLVFIDGIAFNDLAANNQARFETFAADNLDRVELIRGSRSPLCGDPRRSGGSLPWPRPTRLAKRAAWHRWKPASSKPTALRQPWRPAGNEQVSPAP
jgi:hypothetical protein